MRTAEQDGMATKARGTRVGNGKSLEKEAGRIAGVNAMKVGVVTPRGAFEHDAVYQSGKGEPFGVLSRGHNNGIAVTRGVDGLLDLRVGLIGADLYGSSPGGRTET
jgi:hypothetical protein